MDEMTTSWHSYPSSYALGHRALTDLFDGGVLVEEKIDGSQFSFGKFLDPDGIPILRCRSKGAELNLVAPEKMFVKAIEAAQKRFDLLVVGWTYRAEYLAKPKHNTLLYDRVPKDNIIIFDINCGHEDYLPYNKKVVEAERLDLEVVPWIHDGEVKDIDMFRVFLDTESRLGGQKVEGVVVKNYARFGRDKKILIGKFVSEAFKESHGKEWKKEHRTQADIILRLRDQYRTPPRWEKAVMHLRERGLIFDAPQDIGLLIKEVGEDVEKDSADEIKDALFQWAWPQIRRGLHHGLPEWYKERLLVKQFSGEVAERTKAPALKAGAGEPAVGSNPTLSASLPHA